MIREKIDEPPQVNKLEKWNNVAYTDRSRRADL
jgi:hypothetical protein